jgi:hypothetical protein
VLEVQSARPRAGDGHHGGMAEGMTCRFCYFWKLRDVTTWRGTCWQHHAERPATATCNQFEARTVRA